MFVEDVIHLFSYGGFLDILVTYSDFNEGVLKVYLMRVPYKTPSRRMHQHVL